LTLWLEKEIKIPAPLTLRSLAGKLVKGRKRKHEGEALFAAMRNSFREADLASVANAQDMAFLIRDGVASSKIVVQPYGIDQARRQLFDSQPILPENSFRVAFVGTYDARKGRYEFPQFVAAVAAKLPQVRVVLLGTGKTEAVVKADFPKSLASHIEVIPSFEPEQLPQLLAGCTVGVFPSHLEAFGFGVLEMLATGLPVVAYNSPGPPEMLPPEWLVPRGDWSAMAERVLAFLTDPDSQRIASKERARELSRRFQWQQIAAETATLYAEALAQRSL
jgi:glycosyltransferase involved in cell wall biosynthesis